MDGAVDDHGEHEQSEPEREDDERVDQKSKDVTEVDPGAAGAERELVASNKKAPLRHLVAAKMFAAELHPESPGTVALGCDDGRRRNCGHVGSGIFILVLIRSVIHLVSLYALNL